MKKPPEPPAPNFDLSGGALCLDFANTWEDRGRPETERLHGYRHLLAFARQTGMLAEGDLSRLARRARRHPAEAGAVFQQAVEFREALYRIFSNLAAGKRPRAGDLETLNALLAEALPRLRLAPAGDGFAWSWSRDSETLAAPLWPVARSAAEFLTGGDLRRLRECHGHKCTWLFLDRSRNRSRRWCSMSTCGNRAKARRHAQRRKRKDRER